MGLTASFTFNVTPLPENDVWFANSQAWSNYWRIQGGTVSIDPATTTVYVPIAYDNTLQPCHQEIDGAFFDLATVQMTTSLLNRLNALEQSYQDLRNQLKNVGLITNAQ